VGSAPGGAARGGRLRRRVVLGRPDLRLPGNLNIGFDRTTDEAKRLLRLYGSVGNPNHVRIYRRRNALVAWDIKPPPVRRTIEGCLK
jgi:hypothetical protein